MIDRSNPADNAPIISSEPNKSGTQKVLSAEFYEDVFSTMMRTKPIQKWSNEEMAIARMLRHMIGKQRTTYLIAKEKPCHVQYAKSLAAKIEKSIYPVRAVTEPWYHEGLSKLFNRKITCRQSREDEKTIFRLEFDCTFEEFVNWIMLIQQHDNLLEMTFRFKNMPTHFHSIFLDNELSE